MSKPTNRRILLIDDTPSIHEDFRSILSGAGDASQSEMDAAEEALFGEVADPTNTLAFDVDSAFRGAKAGTWSVRRWRQTGPMRWLSST